MEKTKQNKRKKRQERIGRVISSKMDKTISVLTYRLVREKKYGKYMKRRMVFKAHDEKNEAKLGDKVKIFETRPLSKTKRWRMAQLLERQEIQ